MPVNVRGTQFGSQVSRSHPETGLERRLGFHLPGEFVFIEGQKMYSPNLLIHCVYGKEISGAGTGDKIGCFGDTGFWMLKG